MSICWSYSTSKHLQSKPLGMIACCGQLIECVLVYGSSDSMMGMHFTKWVTLESAFLSDRTQDFRREHKTKNARCFVTLPY